MKFNIYSKPGSHLKAIPQGFNVFAFVFHVAWLLSKRMYLVAAFAGVFCIALSVAAITFKSIIFLIPIFIAWFALGFYANNLWAKHLVRKGYKNITSVDAKSSHAAIEQFNSN